MTSTRPIHTKQRITAFTLIELLVVVFIISISASALFINFSQQGPDKNTQQAQQLLRLLQDAQREAIDRRKIIGIHIQKNTVVMSSFVARTAQNNDHTPIYTYANVESWVHSKQLDIKATFVVDYNRKLLWTIHPNQNLLQIIDPDEEEQTFPDVVIMPTGEVQPEAYVQLLNESGTTENIRINWEDSVFSVQEI